MVIYIRYIFYLVHLRCRDLKFLFLCKLLIFWNINSPKIVFIFFMHNNFFLLCTKKNQVRFFFFVPARPEDVRVQKAVPQQAVERRCKTAWAPSPARPASSPHTPQTSAWWRTSPSLLTPPAPQGCCARPDATCGCHIRGTGGPNPAS